MVWATTTRETIKLGPLEISAPESEQMKACRTIQAALHDEIQTLDNERMSVYKTIDNDQNALNEETRLKIDALKRDRDTGSSYNANETAVDNRITQLSDDIDDRNRIIIWIRETITARSQEVYSLCRTIIEAER
jgi:hypothetical protein